MQLALFDDDAQEFMWPVQLRQSAGAIRQVHEEGLSGRQCRLRLTAGQEPQPG